MSLIKPRLLKGFRDFLPSELWQRKYIINIISQIFEKYGYEPLETPALEYFDILMGKYGEQEKLVYNFEDFGKRRVALKYDLTVPASRVMAQYQNEIQLPWKRYQIQPVWRADNTQKGRYREFYQCDADVFGSSDVIVDAEYIAMGIEIFEKLGFKDFIVRLNNRKLLNGISKYLEAEEKFYDLVYVIDDWDKRDINDNKLELKRRGFNDKQIQMLMNLMGLDLKDIKVTIDNDEAQNGINELESIIKYVKNDKVKFDLTIARGLSYYTGPVWEWSIIEGNIGSVGGCGRYDNLVKGFTGIETPATGGSFGLERIFQVMKDRNMLPIINNKVKILLTLFNQELKEDTFALANKIRNKGISLMLYPNIKPLKKQYEYADKKGIDYVITYGEDEKKLGLINLKNMKEKKQENILIIDFLNNINNYII